jgi:hypothetical protein
MDDRAEAARDLVLAIFRLAVSDYLGLSYGHDGPDRLRHCGPPSRAVEAGLFLTTSWAAHLAELAGFCSELVWREARVESKAMTVTSTDRLELEQAA